MADSDNYSIIPFNPFDQGIDKRSTRTFMPQGKVPEAYNVHFEPGRVVRRGGYAKRCADIARGASAQLGNLPLDDHDGTALPVLGLIDFYTSAGTATEVVLSTEYVYSFLPFAETPSLTSVFQDSDGPEAIPCFNGGTGGVLSWTEAPKSNGTIEPIIIFTDGQEYATNHTVYFWDGGSAYSNATPATALTAGRIDMTYFTDLNYVKQVIYFADHLLVGNYSDNNNVRRKGVAWGGFLSASIDDSENDDHGEYDIADARGQLKRFIRLGAHLAIYFDKSIVICDPTYTDSIYSFDVRVQGTGIAGANAVADIGGVHIFIGEDNVYLYDGGLHPVPVGDEIADILIPSINPLARDRILAHHIPSKFRVFFFVPTGSSTYPTEWYAYDYQRRTWARGNLNHQLSAVGYGTPTTTGNYCDSTIYSGEYCDGTYGGVYCDEAGNVAGFASPTMGTSDGYIFNTFSGSSSDNGVPFSGQVETDDKPLSNIYGAFGRVIELHVESVGGPFFLEYSTNQGTTWTLATSSELGGHDEFDFDTIRTNFIGEFIRFRCRSRIQALDGTLYRAMEIRVIKVKVKPITDRDLNSVY